MKELNLKLKNDKSGITLIALVITIVVLLIIAGVSIATLTGDNGILTRASDAKIETALGAVKESIKLEQTEKIMYEEKMTPETMLAEGKVNRTVQQGKDNQYYMYYSLKKNAYKGMSGLGKGNIASLKDVFLIDDNLNVKYIASNGKEYGDDISNKILEDETEIKFSSKVFSEYVSKISGVKEEELKFKWMKNQTSLIIADTSVDSLQDLVFFPNLERLTLGDTANKNIPPITSMDGIENCKKISRIIIYNGPNKDYSSLSKLTNLTSFVRWGESDYEELVKSLESSPNLKNLEIQYSKVDLDIKVISKLKNLESLVLQGSKITQMDALNNMISLKRLSLQGDKINKIERLDNLSNLETLYLNNNNISKIEGLEKLKSLKTLYLSNNQIIDITPLSANTSLNFLDLTINPNLDANRKNYTGERLEALNKIGEILDRGGTINIDADKLGLFTNYKKLNLSNQNLTTLESLEGLTQLVSLNLSFNQLTLEDDKSQEILESMINLKDLVLNYNKVTKITPIKYLTQLKYLYLIGDNNNVNLEEIEDIISNLDVLRVSTNSLKTILNCDIDKITRLSLSDNYLKELPDLSKFTKLTTLNLRNNANISSFYVVSKITSLQDLNLSVNNLRGRMIDFSKLTNLTSLNLSENTLWSEDLENLKALKNNSKLSIDLSKNSIIDASALLELNPNTKINLTGNINLSQDSKDKLKARFGNNVTYDK